MAERRMFAKSVTQSARFLTLPAAARLLYYDLGMAADDDGVVEAFMVLRMTGAGENDLCTLEEKGFLTRLNNDLVTHITDWQRNNLIRQDRYRESIYAPLLESAGLKKEGNFSGPQRLTQDRIGEDRVDQERIGQVSGGEDRGSARMQGQARENRTKASAPDSVTAPPIQEAFLKDRSQEDSVTAPPIQEAFLKDRSQEDSVTAPPIQEAFLKDRSQEDSVTAPPIQEAFLKDRSQEDSVTAPPKGEEHCRADPQGGFAKDETGEKAKIAETHPKTPSTPLAPPLTEAEKKELLANGVPEEYAEARLTRAAEYAKRHGDTPFGVLLKWWREDRAKSRKYGRYSRGTAFGGGSFAPSGALGNSFETDDFLAAAIARSEALPLPDAPVPPPAT